MEERFAVSVDEAAQLLGVGRSTLWQLVTSGEIPSFTIGKRRLIPLDALRRWIAERTEQAT